MSLKENTRVFSIQSHVVHGYCGNKSAVFPLQVLGIEVDQINSVQLSNHTGYKTIKGQILSEKELEDLFDGLVANEIHKLYTHLLTGYVGNENFLRQIKEIIKKLRDGNPNIVYVCDPVLGDYYNGVGKMYVPESLLPIYRTEIIPLADIVTPNQFEVEMLTGIKIINEEDAWRAMEWFHQQGVKIVALSSSNVGGNEVLIAFISAKGIDDKFERFKLSIPKQGTGIHLTGTGDLFAALFMAHSTYLPNDLGRALELTIASVQSTIETTLYAMPEELRSGKKSPTALQRELKIIQSKKHIENPDVKLKAERVE